MQATKCQSQGELAITTRSIAPVRQAVRVAMRGVTLVEVLIVVAIMSLIATTVVVAVIPKFQSAQSETALNSMREIRNAVVRWRATRGGDQCPTVSQLVSDKEIDTASKTEDPWNSQFKIVCTEDEIFVTSPGRDKREGTADDLSVPKGTPAGR
ncbi:MAG TPA: type II secretion system protein [Polyangiaceae bacterium]|nr:type II secretion system protein [Polyangiaceae bacterium]